jgi:hypothetical protein
MAGTESKLALKKLWLYRTKNDLPLKNTYGGFYRIPMGTELVCMGQTEIGDERSTRILGVEWLFHRPLTKDYVSVGEQDLMRWHPALEELESFQITLEKYWIHKSLLVPGALMEIVRPLPIMETLGLKIGDQLKVRHSSQSDLIAHHNFEVLRKDPPLPITFEVEEYYFDPVIRWDELLRKVD